MSMPDGCLRCTACVYRGFIVFRRITLAYHFADGAAVHGHRGMRWCNECRNPRDVEGAQPTIEPLQIELDTLRATFATPGYRVKRWVSRLLRQDAGTLVVRAVELRAAKDRARKKVQVFGCRPHRAHYQQNPASSAVPALNWNTICFK